jgi:hypothetical protein
MTTPPPGNEPRHQRECNFCPRVGNRFKSGHRNYEQWVRCKPTGAGRSLKLPEKKYFILIAPIPGLTIPTGVTLCEELRKAQRMDCPTPHWSCTKCADINRRWLRSVGDVAAAAKLRESDRSPSWQAKWGEDGRYDRNELFSSLYASVSLTSMVQAEGVARAVSEVKETAIVSGARKSLSVAAPQYAAAKRAKRSGFGWEMDETKKGAIQGWSMFAIRLMAIPDAVLTTELEDLRSGDVPTIGDKISGLLKVKTAQISQAGVIRFIDVPEDMGEVSRYFGRLACVSKQMWRALREETTCRRERYFNSAAVLRGELRTMTAKWARNLENRPQGYIRRANALERKIKAIEVAQRDLRGELEGVKKDAQKALKREQAKTKREKVKRRQAERRAGDPHLSSESSDDEDGQEQPGYTPLRKSKNGPYTDEYRDEFVKDVSSRGWSITWRSDFRKRWRSTCRWPRNRATFITRSASACRRLI